MGVESQCASSGSIWFFGIAEVGGWPTVTNPKLESTVTFSTVNLGGRLLTANTAPDLLAAAVELAVENVGRTVIECARPTNIDFALGRGRKIG